MATNLIWKSPPKELNPFVFDKGRVIPLSISNFATDNPALPLTIKKVAGEDPPMCMFVLFYRGPREDIRTPDEVPLEAFDMEVLGIFTAASRSVTTATVFASVNITANPNITQLVMANYSTYCGSYVNPQDSKEGFPQEQCYGSFSPPVIFEYINGYFYSVYNRYFSEQDIDTESRVFCIYGKDYVERTYIQKRKTSVLTVSASTVSPGVTATKGSAKDVAAGRALYVEPAGTSTTLIKGKKEFEEFGKEVKAAGKQRENLSRVDIEAGQLRPVQTNPGVATGKK